MKQFLLLIFFCSLFTIASAQTTPANITVKGIVIDSAVNKPLGYVTVVLQDATTKTSVKSTLTKDDGSFELKVAEGKTYQLTVAFIGYASKTVAVKAGSAIFDAGKIFMSASSKQLGEVSVTAVRPVMKREVDRLTYDVQADPESKAISALDMMRKVPLLSVDGDDKIKLKGSGNYKILVNGKESALMAKNPSDVLKAMPATNIERIEVITTPPAKYDAEGLSGIINIITKKNADQGYNGSVNMRYNSVWGPGYNLNATVKQGKFGLSGYAGFGNQKKANSSSESSQIQNATQSVLNQNGNGFMEGKYKYANAELSYEVDSLNLLTGSFEFFQGNFNQNSDQRSIQTNSDGTIAQAYRSTNINDRHDKGTDIAVNYQLGFKDQKDELLTASYKYSYSPGTQNNSNDFSERINFDKINNPNFRQYNKSGTKEHTFQLDYVYPFKKINLEAGGKAILRNNFSDYSRENQDAITSDYATDPSQTNIFNYHQDVYSAYNSYQIKFTKWTAKAGLRLEHTQISADFSDAPLDRGYNNFIPSVSVQRSFKSSSVNFGFTQRIQRPGIYQLNPFVDNSNPKFVTTGNPQLRPELNNTFELTYSNFSKGSINAGLSYAFSNNSIQNVSTLIDTVTYTTYQNLGSNRTLGLNLNTNFNITKQFTVSINGELSHIWLKGTYNGNFYTNDGYTGRAFGNLAYKFDGGYRLALDAGYFSGDVTLQGKSSAFIFNSYVVSKEFFKKTFTVSLVANNPYSKYRSYHGYTRTNDFYNTYSGTNPNRNFAIRLNYKFGKLNSEIKKNQRGINNDDTKGGGKSSGGNQ
jgi:outer membrane receptor protein involved in Fe transport